MQAIDNALLRVMIGWGEASPVLWTTTRWLTELGGAKWLVPLTLVVALWLFIRGEKRRAITVLAVVLGGRGLVEWSKWLLDRQRPDLIEHPMAVHSLSFPSGHAGNSTIVYLALALIVAPLFTRRKWPVPTAAVLAVVVGMTRPILGVHWPTDVLAGWSLGVAWTLTMILLLRPWMEGRPAFRSPPIR